MAVEKPENLFSIRGNQFDLLISTLNAGYLLLVVTKKTKSPVSAWQSHLMPSALSITDLQAKISQSVEASRGIWSRRCCRSLQLKKQSSRKKRILLPDESGKRN